MAARTKTNIAVINGITVLVSGAFPRIARVRSDQFETIEDPPTFISAVVSNVKADIFPSLKPLAIRSLGIHTTRNGPNSPY
jgi:hypothetical protein